MQLMTVNTKSREFPKVLNRMLASQENVNAALSLQGEDALTLIDILDQVSRPTGMALGAPHLIAPHRLTMRRTSLSIFGDGVCASSGDFVDHRTSYHALASSQKTYRKRETLYSLLVGSRTCGKAVTMGILCA